MGESLATTTYSPISLLVWIIVVCLVFWCVGQLASAFGLPAPIVTVVYVILVVMVVIALLQLLQGGSLSLPRL